MGVTEQIVTPIIIGFSLMWAAYPALKYMGVF